MVQNKPLDPGEKDYSQEQSKTRRLKVESLGNSEWTASDMMAAMSGKIQIMHRSLEHQLSTTYAGINPDKFGKWLCISESKLPRRKLEKQWLFQVWESLLIVYNRDCCREALLRRTRL